MELSTEQLSKLEKWLESLWGRIATGGTIGAWIALSTWLTTDTVGRISLLANGALLLLAATLYLRLHKIQRGQGIQQGAPAIAAASWEPDDESRTVLCCAVDAYPNRLQDFEFVEKLKNVLSEAKIQRALGMLEKNGYLYFHDGLSYEGQRVDIDPYEATTKGRIYVEDWRRERGY